MMYMVAAMDAFRFVGCRAPVYRSTDDQVALTLGKLRFHKPQPLKPSGYLRPANKVAPSCMQFTPHSPEPITPQESTVSNRFSTTSSSLAFNTSSIASGAHSSASGPPSHAFPGSPEVNTTFSEDCLYLNIWTPFLGTRLRTPRPVLVFIHGGGFRMGSASVDTYDGGVLSAYGDIVVVSFNYRLGAFGFLQLNSKIAGNMGLYDQIRALEWVQHNVEYFGGDPRQVTVMGQEAGAVSLGMLLLSPLCKGLLQQAILLSGFTENEGFMQAYKLFPGIFNFERPVNLSLQDAEDILMDAVELFPETAKDYMKDMYFGKLEASSPAADIRNALAKAFGDIFVTCPVRIFAESYGDRPMNAFLYQFTHRPLFSTNPPSTGATSFDDVPYIFGEPLRYPERFPLDDISITKMMMNLITSFVKTGTPQPVRDFLVPKFESPELQYVELGSSGVIERKYPSKQCDFWKKFYPKNS
ncbi:acetylcholinesterase-like [Tropilaelaps mercedesae]|uniref:Acetylcholinesterase-like n=1 Tax=Tropilaelaps mercedesae TaxID=418985 RepID=A0A1V9X936_9ACAR|nr:acetylcholinesterase-like [Tropilaelaps mercedesae]